MSAPVEITRRIELDAGHRVPGHKGHCRYPHGHRYVIEVTVTGPVQDDGMVVDFGILKQVLMDHVHAAWDHAFLVWHADHEVRQAFEGRGWRLVVLPHPPTAEHLAQLILSAITKPLHLHSITPTRVVVWETPNARAEARP